MDDRVTLSPTRTQTASLVGRDLRRCLLQWVLSLLPRISDLISLLAAARSQLLAKLDAIALLAGGFAERNTL